MHALLGVHSDGWAHRGCATTGLGGLGPGGGRNSRTGLLGRAGAFNWNDQLEEACRWRVAGARPARARGWGAPAASLLAS